MITVDMKSKKVTRQGEYPLTDIANVFAEWVLEQKKTTSRVAKEGNNEDYHSKPGEQVS